MSCDNCLGLTIPDSFEDGCELLTKDCGIQRLYVALCNHEFTGLDQEDFDAAEAADALKALPIGNVTITATSGTPIKISACKEIPGRTTYTLAYTSVSMSEGTDMYTYWQSIFAAKVNLTILWQGCDGLWFLNPEWVAWNNAGASPGSVPTEPIGINASMTSPPLLIRNDTTELCEWTVTFTFKLDDVLVPTELPGVEL